MILISIQPFALKKMFAFAATVVCLSTASCFAASMLLSVDATPYDRQMNRIRPVLTSSSAGGGQNISMAIVNHWMQDLRDIPYGYQMEWKTPQEVQTRQPADCKGKAVALYQRMLVSGAKNVRLVIGKRAPTSRMTHAWLIWEANGGSYVLDPTFNWMACRSEEIGEHSYVPLYAYAGGKKYRAASSEALLAKN
jgi:predicted transglutaminase-like cysteine proteinase